MGDVAGERVEIGGGELQTLGFLGGVLEVDEGGGLEGFAEEVFCGAVREVSGAGGDCRADVARFEEASS